MDILFSITILGFVSLLGIDATLVPQDLAGLSDRQIIEYLVTSVSRLDNEHMKQQQRIEDLESIVHSQNEIIKELQTTGKEKYILTETLLRTSSDLLAHVHEKASGHGIPKPAQPSRTNWKWPSKQSMKSRRRQLTGTPIAFSAVASKNELHLGAHQNLVFESTNVNTNNVYNTHHGVFTAPVPGVYVITSTVLAFNNREVWCDITVNGAVKAHVYARGTDNRHDQGSNTILLHLNQGDNVSVQNQAADDAVWGEGYTTFSGFLLYEEEQSPAVG